jgi:hypothetical protein
LRMATFINTGSTKCRVLNLLECPICGDEFENTDGVFVESTTVGDKVLVCPKHREVSANDEAAIQSAIHRAIDAPRGHILFKGKLVKKYEFFDKFPSEVSKALKL